MSPEDMGESKCAIDDTMYEDEDVVEGRRNQSVENKRKHYDPTLIRVQEIVPFHFSPIFLPLTPSHVDSCVELENAAFTNPDHRATPEKVNHSCLSVLNLLFSPPNPFQAPVPVFASTNPNLNPPNTFLPSDLEANACRLD